eukprot:TRINITY_DN10356_c0_g1_i1.p1 TRINITY_DN10356_c0_g1~~TRINITY_DN10356_c0_g1_i1.p1  ORF type:complete len:681 (+),score=124.15 TRINITY_DN10356_c0_g1_i1:199-2241(+)
MEMLQPSHQRNTETMDLVDRKRSDFYPKSRSTTFNERGAMRTKPLKKGQDCKRHRARLKRVEQIEKLLRRLGREAREEVILRRLTQWQRLELEQLMLQRRAEESDRSSQETIASDGPGNIDRTNDDGTLSGDSDGSATTGNRASGASSADVAKTIACARNGAIRNATRADNVGSGSSIRATTQTSDCGNIIAASSTATGPTACGNANVQQQQPPTLNASVGIPPRATAHGMHHHRQCRKKLQQMCQSDVKRELWQQRQRQPQKHSKRYGLPHGTSSNGSFGSWNPSGHGIFRRCHQGGPPKYRANLSLCGLRLRAMARASLDQSKKDLATLVNICRLVRKQKGQFEDCVRNAIRTSLTDFATAPGACKEDTELSFDATGMRELGLTMQVATCAVYRQVLLSPTYTLNELDKALSAWRLLHGARSSSLQEGKSRRRNPVAMQASWEHIQKSLLELWKATGAVDERVLHTFARVEKLVESRFQQEWERWNRHQMAKEERLMRQNLRAEQRSAKMKLQEDRRSRLHQRSVQRETRIVKRLEKLIPKWLPPRRQRRDALSDSTCLDVVTTATLCVHNRKKRSNPADAQASAAKKRRSLTAPNSKHRGCSVQNSKLKLSLSDGSVAQAAAPPACGAVFLSGTRSKILTEQACRTNKHLAAKPVACGSAAPCGFATAVTTVPSTDS